MTPEIIVRNRVFEDAEIKAYFENPRIYEANTRALDGAEYALNEQRNLSNRKTAYQSTRMLPSAGGVIDVGGVIRERGIIFWEENERQYRIQKQLEMASNPDEVRTVARRIREALYDSNGDQFLKDHYQTMHLYEGDNKLPNPVPLNGLKLQFPEISSLYDDDNFTDEQKEKFCDGNLTTEELKDILHLDDKEYEKYLKEKLKIDLPESEKLPSTFNKNELTEEEFRKQKQTKIVQFQDKVNENRAVFYAGTSILSLIDLKMSQQLSNAANAGFMIYEGVGLMVINGAIDPTNLSNIANGVGIVINLFANTPSTDQGMIEMLSAILDSQKEILLELKNIDSKIDRLQLTIDSLTNLVEKNHAQTIQELRDIQFDLASIEATLAENEEFARLLSQEEVIKNFDREQATLIRPFKNLVGSQFYEQFIKKINNPSFADAAADTHFLKINSLLDNMHEFATHQLEDPKYLTFTDKSDIATLNIFELKAKEKLDISQLMGMLPSASSWMKQHLTFGRPRVFYESDFEGDKNDGTGINLIIGNPAIFTHILDI